MNPTHSAAKLTRFGVARDGYQPAVTAGAGAAAASGFTS